MQEASAIAAFFDGMTPEFQADYFGAYFDIVAFIGLAQCGIGEFDISKPSIFRLPGRAGICRVTGRQLFNAAININNLMILADAKQVNAARLVDQDAFDQNRFFGIATDNQGQSYVQG